MSRVWGRAETYHWPSDKPVWTITALALTVAAVLAAAGYEYTRKWTYFQQAYLGTYIGSEVRLWSKTAPSLIAYRIEGKQKRAAVSRDHERYGDLSTAEAGRSPLKRRRGLAASPSSMGK
jgi:hypothetical protein